MQSEECRHTAGVSAAGVHGYAIFQLAGLLGVPQWRNGLSLAFPASDVDALNDRAVTPACIGMLGIAGVLPYYYTEAVARAGGGAARDFIDLLSAPAIEVFCRAWREGRPECMPLPSLPTRRGPVRARALGEQLAQALGVPVRVEQFAGRWESLSPRQASALGQGHICCGAGALLGERLWRIDSAVRIHVGPLDMQSARAFLPGGRGAQALAQLWHLAADECGVQAEARIHLAPGVSAGAVLGSGPRLDHDALLATQAIGERDDLCYQLC